METQQHLIEKYFNLGLQNKEILVFLRSLHNIHISERTIKRRLDRLNLRRRKNWTDLEDVIKYLQHILSSSGQMHGYRWVHLKCLQSGLVVSQRVVREILKLLDPEGVEYRKRHRLRRRQYSNKGPNFLWHVDSYDKLKRYGICINGCIDGFSRHIIWLRAGCSSSDPKVIAGYYLDAIRQLGGCPETIRTDNGTENGNVEKIQVILTDLYRNNAGNKPAFIYGRSTANQRIESWWSILRKHNSQYWITLFETLRDDGLFDGSYLDKSLIQFCFMDIIQVSTDIHIFIIHLFFISVNLFNLFLWLFQLSFDKLRVFNIIESVLNPESYIYHNIL